MIRITPQDIEYAEKILLSEGEHFDDYSKSFISSLGTLDLQAVPGSGKTTVLLAKLLILDRYMPFSDGSGVLVISHTNAAVDEIEARICKYSPHLFSHTNFIGTIQSFIDEFLAIPFYTNKYKKKPIRIDDEIYCQHQYAPPQAKGWLNNRLDKEEILSKSRLRGEDDLTYGFAEKNFPLRNKNRPTYKAILEMKLKTRKRGYLCFDDAYILAFEYLQRNPRIKAILQKRFKYVFVDEMQDMDNYQQQAPPFWKYPL